MLGGSFRSGYPGTAEDVGRNPRLFQSQGVLVRSHRLPGPGPGRRREEVPEPAPVRDHGEEDEHMDKNSESVLVRRLHELVSPIVADLGLDLYDLEFGAGLLKITIDTPPGSPGGVDVDALAQCTRLVSRELDHSDPIPGHYTLEVSSPGLERALRTPRHFQREVGKTVNIRLRDVGNESRRVSGVLVGADDDGVVVLTDSGEQSIAYARIDRARTVFVWEAAPKPGGKGRPPASKNSRATADSSSDKSRSQSKKTGDKS